RPAAVGERDDLSHDRAESRDGARAKVVAVRKAAGEDHDVALLQIVVLVPEERRLFADAVDDGAIRVVIAIGRGEGDDAELHVASTAAISKSSVTGFASSRSHISRVERSASCASPASSSTTRWRPT